MRTIPVDKVSSNQKTTDNELHVWFNDDEDFEVGTGWYSCFSGYQDGLYSESDNYGPFDSDIEAIEEARDQYTNWHQS